MKYTCGESDVFYQTNSRYEQENTTFAYFKTYVNYLSRSEFSSNDISHIAQTQHLRESQIPKDQNLCSRCDKCFFKKYFYLSVSPSYFSQANQFY